MNELIGVPPPPGDGGNKTPRTVQELRQAIESGQLAGEIVHEGKAAAELEQRRKTIIRAGEITSGRLQQAAKDLESAVGQMVDDERHNLMEKHAMISDALAFRRVAHWLHFTDHPQAQPETRNGETGV
jgi:hypothetical protein